MAVGQACKLFYEDRETLVFFEILFSLCSWDMKLIYRTLRMSPQSGVGLDCRFRDTSSSCDASSKRYVITNPPDDFKLLPTDQVFVLMQFDPGLEYKPNRGDMAKDDNSWLLLCSALTDGPYSYIWKSPALHPHHTNTTTHHPLITRCHPPPATCARPWVQQRMVAVTCCASAVLPSTVFPSPDLLLFLSTFLLTSSASFPSLPPPVLSTPHCSHPTSSPYIF